MIAVNMWFIKHSNGLFHYGLDYAEALGPDVREIWVRNTHLAETARKRLPAASIHVLTFGELLTKLRRRAGRDDLLFTPSSHPLALISRQVIVLHDSYPFAGGRGAIKQALFRVAMATSGTIAAYINQADGYQFLIGCGIGDARTHYLPNRIADGSTSRKTLPKTLGGSLVIGLFGSDSPKKNYDALFESAAATTGHIPVLWRIFGHPNAYTDRLQADYPQCSIEIVGSDAVTMDAFIGSIDLALSVAEGEGFARPVASALMRGVPTLLLDTPVFREFYRGSARLFATVDELVGEVAAMRSGDQLEASTFLMANDMHAAFDAGIAWLRSFGRLQASGLVRRARAENGS